jgi:hypothetical protein
MAAQPDHWNQHARQWSLIGSPLRPVIEDIELLETEFGDWCVSNALTAPRALLCGVTPEVAGMRWPAGTRLVAVDHSRSMISGVWPGAETPGIAVCGDWLRLPLADASRHLLVGDGCYSLLVGRAQYAAFAAELRRVAADHALLAMRYFVRPEVSETMAEVIDALRQRRIGNFHVFKWRLAMALHGTLEQGVRLSDVWETWHDAVPDPEKLANHLGWPAAVVNTINNYRNVETRYSFPTLAEVRASTGAFEITAMHMPAYELGERCPTLIMRPL